MVAFYRHFPTHYDCWHCRLCRIDGWGNVFKILFVSLIGHDLTVDWTGNPHPPYIHTPTSVKLCWLMSSALQSNVVKKTRQVGQPYRNRELPYNIISIKPGGGNRCCIPARSAAASSSSFAFLLLQQQQHPPACLLCSIECAESTTQRMDGWRREDWLKFGCQKNESHFYHCRKLSDAFIEREADAVWNTVLRGIEECIVLFLESYPSSGSWSHQYWGLLNGEKLMDFKLCRGELCTVGGCNSRWRQFSGIVDSMICLVEKCRLKITASSEMTWISTFILYRNFTCTLAPRRQISKPPSGRTC